MTAVYSWRISLLLVAFSGVVAGCGGVPPDGNRDFRSQAAAIIGGSVEEGFPQVVSVGGGGGFCSGTLVAPRLVFTAGHCVGTGPATDLTVYFGPSPFSDEGTRVATSETVSHPDKDLSNPRDPQHDVAVIYLAEDAPFTPMAVYWGALTDGDVGSDAWWVGFGFAGEAEPPRVKRSADIPIAGVGEPWFYGTDEDGKTACAGDSGGTVVREGAGSFELIGIIHGSGEACAEGSVATRIDDNSEFLMEHVLAAGGTIDPTDGGGCQVPAQSPSLPATLLFIAAAWAMQRRRRR